MPTSNVPTIQITATGVSVPASQDILSGVLLDWNAAFGGNLNITTISTPQGALSSDTTEYIQAANASVAYMISQVDPATSEGRMQDGIARIYFLTRKPATASVVSATCTGQPGVTLPAGSQALDNTNRTWVSLGAGTFSGSGLATIQFACSTLGPEQLGIGDLNRIGLAVTGWDAITNLAAATVGSSVESRADFEVRRSQSVAKNAHGSVAAMFGNVAAVDSVIDVFAVDNFTNAIVNYGSTNYPLAPHSIYIAVVGGTDTDVAQAIFEKKDAGCDMNGNTTVVVPDESSYVSPPPNYNIKFQRPAALSIKVAVVIASNPLLPSNIVDLTKEAVLASFNGEDGGPKTRIGNTIYASRFYGGVVSIDTSVAVISIKIGTSTPTLDSVAVGIDQTPTLASSDISVTFA